MRSGVTLKSIIPSTFFEWLGAMLAAFSIIALLKHGFDYGLSRVFEVLLSYYDDTLNILLGWAQAPLNQILTRIGSFFNISLSLGVGWQHIAVLIGLYFFRNVGRIIVRGGLFAGLYQLCIGFVILILASAGASAHDFSNKSYWAQFSIAFFPILGIFVFSIFQGVWFARFPRDRIHRIWPDFGGSWIYFVAMQTWYGFRQAAIGALILAAGLHVPFLKALKSPGLAMLAILMVLLALHWIVVGANAVRRRNASPNEEPIEFVNTPGAVTGFSMLATVALAFLFMVFNAGLILYAF